jgi:hypothetical protein
VYWGQTGIKLCSVVESGRERKREEEKERERKTEEER